MTTTTKIQQKARRGDLAAYEVKRSYTTQTEHVRYSRWRLGIVHSVTRGGEIKTLLDWTLGSTVEVKDRHGHRPMHIGYDVLCVPSDVMDLAAMRAAGEKLEGDFETLAELRDDIREYKIS